jgi:hypothetical protein
MSLSNAALWDESLRSVTVHQFFTTANWTGVAPAIATDSAATQLDGTAIASMGFDPLTPLPLSLSVSQFLTAVNWDGLVMIETGNGTPIADSKTAAEEATSVYTLSDFSDLF